MAKKNKKSSKPVEPEELDEELDEELEELDEDEAVEAAPKKKTKNTAEDEEPVFGAGDLARLASKSRDKPITPRDLRTLLRKMARDGRLNREITAGNRTRYSWSGPNDPEVKAILKALTGGELEQGKLEALQKLKEGKAVRQAAKDKAAKKLKKAAKTVSEDDDDDE